MLHILNLHSEQNLQCIANNTFVCICMFTVVISTTADVKQIFKYSILQHQKTADTVVM